MVISTCGSCVNLLCLCITGFGGGPGKPPMHPRHPNGSVRKRKHEPPVIRNPYLTPGTDNNHIYHAANYNFTMAALQQRLL